MIKVYAIPVSLYCAKLRILMRHKNLDWQEILPPGGYGSAEYATLVPAGNLPALEHNGFLLGDSEAIAEYLNEICPEPDMLPGDAKQRAAIRARSRFHDTRLEPAVRSLFPHIKNANRDTAFVKQQWSVVQQGVDQLTRLLPVTIEVLTLGDCGFPITCAWIEELARHFGLEPASNDRVKDYLGALERFDAVASELADYRPRLVEWLGDQ
ncbi:MAG: glutathione S-transferase family protein [Pseudomonadota bacterium]